MASKHLTLNQRDLLASLAAASEQIWSDMAESYPSLVRHDVPSVKLNSRLWRCAGKAWGDDGKNFVELGTKFFLFSQETYSYMFRIILPHELAHLADFRLFGPSEKVCGHGVKWAEIMVNYGLPADKFHTMEIPQTFRIRTKK